MKMYNIQKLKNVIIDDKFWSKYINLVHNVVIPYQWEVINDRAYGIEPSHSVENFRIAAGLKEGEFYGFVFQDTDLAKWLETVSYKLEVNPDKNIEKIADEAIEIIGKAQGKDGYINTYFTIKEPGGRWENLTECHELYTAGHLMEAAVAHYKATGKRNFLDIMCKFADYIESTFGEGDNKIKGYPGHQEIELALAKLYEVTEEKKYLKLSKFFLDQRGKEPNYFVEELKKRGGKTHFGGSNETVVDTKYNQSHLPVREQEELDGHSVRAMYMLTGMAHVGLLDDDKTLLDACETMWNNVVKKRMYITGGFGSQVHGEAFSLDYDLPNDTMYTETCATIGFIFFAFRMLQRKPDRKYSDELERALYNNALAGMSQDGKSFFYVNPLEVLPEVHGKNKNFDHVKPVRQKWFSCACCPPNITRLISSIGQYIYTSNNDEIYAHLYISGKTTISIDSTEVEINQKSNYPWEGNISFEILPQIEKEFTIGLRVPGWCSKSELKINRNEEHVEMKNGYLIIKRIWRNNDKIDLNLDIPIEFIQSNPKVRYNNGKIAIKRGPIVYCIEEIDNGKDLSTISISLDSELSAEYENNFFGGCIVLKGKGYRIDDSNWKDYLYKPVDLKEKEINIKAIPYFLWGNRRPGEMQVWIRYK